MSEATPANPELVSKVTFSPVSDGKTDALIVTIKSVVPEGQDYFRAMDTPKSRSMSLDSKKRTRRTSSKQSSKTTMTEEDGNKAEASTSTEDISPARVSTDRAISSDSPCLKHAADNIARKASHIPQEKLSLCKNCSSSMLSYIFVVQDFLDSLAKEIIGDSSSQSCLQCLKQENRQSIGSSEVFDDSPSGDRVKSTKPKIISSKQKQVSRSDSQQEFKKGARSETNREVRKYEESSEQLIQRTLAQHMKEKHQPLQAPYGSQASNTDQRNAQTIAQQNNKTGSQPHLHDGHTHASKVPCSEDYQDSGSNEHHGVEQQQSSHHAVEQNQGSHQAEITLPGHYVASPDAVPDHHAPVFLKPQNRLQPNFTDQSVNQHIGSSSAPLAEGATSPFSEGVDGIVSTLSNAEREVYDSARNVAGWDTLAEPQERLISATQNQIPSEAYVTMCRNNAEALGCLVLGASLLLCRTTRTLCVLISDGVSNAFIGPLSSVFHVVQTTRSLDSLGTTKLALLEQPDLGVSFDKLNIWRLVQFNKCVYLNPDTLVLQNCDELFCHKELSAVPDIGWPDCFNSGVFVFVPSQQTFWQLLEFAEKQGSYDGGDQGLLNSFFNSWSDDLSNKLSFIYNLMANVSYTYTPAFKQFGRNVKIVQFHGSFKPWHVKFFSRTGLISPSSTVHPTYVQFVHVWLNIFRLSALRQLTRDVQAYAHSQDEICAVELLRFFPLPLESEAEFFLTPPSVRLRLAERKLDKQPTKTEALRRKSAEYRHKPDDEVIKSAEFRHKHDDDVVKSADFRHKPDEDESPLEQDVFVPDVKEESVLPGAEVGDYQGMKAWEQGRMDYQGTASSETIIRRLQFLMEHSA